MGKKTKLRKSGALTGASGRKKAAKQEVKKRGRYQKDPGMPSGNYIKTKTGQKVRKKKPPKSMK